MTALSVLDLVMIGEDKDLATAIEESRQLARHVDRHGYTRYWIAEHHDMPGIGSAATSSSSTRSPPPPRAYGWERAASCCPTMRPWR